MVLTRRRLIGIGNGHKNGQRKRELEKQLLMNLDVDLQNGKYLIISISHSVVAFCRLFLFNCLVSLKSMLLKRFILIEISFLLFIGPQR